MATPKQTDPQFKLRFTPELRAAIEAAAKVNNRSMNAEIVARLEDYPRISLLEIAVSRSNQIERDLREEIETLRKEARENFSRANVYEKRLMVAEAEQKRLEQQNTHLQRANENLSQLLQSAANLSDRLSDAEERATKFEKLMRQARQRLGVVRQERDALDRFAKAMNEGYEKTFMGEERISDMTDRELLLRLYYDVARLNAEMAFDRRHKQVELPLFEGDESNDDQMKDKPD